MFIVFDLDGTLADITHRTHFVRGSGKPDWNSFFAECGRDALNTPVAEALDAHLRSGHRVEIWSGRSAVVEAETQQWLYDNGIDPHLLTRMRPAGDNTPDTELKRSWLHELHPDDRPDIVYDDRQRVVDMWRDEGVTCFQVAPNWEASQRIEPICDPLLTIMVGPSGGGKSTWCNEHVPASQLVSSDALRQEYCGDFRDQSRNDDVFNALHRLAKARLDCGLPVTIDATNLRRRDRLACVALAPEGAGVRYVVIDRPLAEKVRDGGWRNKVMIKGKSLVETHHERMQSVLKDVLSGDGMPNVTVVGLREFASGGTVNGGKSYIVGEAA